MNMGRRLLPALALLLALSTIAVAQGPRLFSREWYAQFSGAYSQPVAPFRIVGNIYYVGALNIASYLIATPQGHILIDSGMTEMHDAIASSVETTGLQGVRHPHPAGEPRALRPHRGARADAASHRCAGDGDGRRRGGARKRARYVGARGDRLGAGTGDRGG